MNNLNWFKKRQGKRIYRDKGTCDCKDCQEVEKNGLIIRADINNEDIIFSHAEYLYDNQCEQGLKYYESNNKQ